MSGFKSEQELVDLFKSTFDNKIITSKIKIMEEVGVGFGFADLVITELKGFISSPKRNKLSFIDISVYQVVESKKELPIDIICTLTGIRQNEVRKSLDRLVDYNFVRDAGSSFRINTKYVLPFKKSSAFEAKLKNWKRAMNQAYRYKWFADYAYVIMDETHSRQAVKNLSEFKNLNIGLLTISTDGNIITHYKPRKKPPLDPGMQMMFSEEILYH